MASDVVGLLVVVAAVINIAAAVGFLYLLIDRYVCLRATFRLQRCLRRRAPGTYRNMLWSTPFQWLFDPGRLEDFLLSSDMEEHDDIRRRKEDCRCWLEQYRSLPGYLLRIAGIALISGAFLIVLLTLAAIRLDAV